MIPIKERRVVTPWGVKTIFLPRAPATRSKIVQNRTALKLLRVRYYWIDILNCFNKSDRLRDKYKTKLLLVFSFSRSKEKALRLLPYE